MDRYVLVVKGPDPYVPRHPYQVLLATAPAWGVLLGNLARRRCIAPDDAVLVSACLLGALSSRRYSRSPPSSERTPAAAQPGRRLSTHTRAGDLDEIESRGAAARSSRRAALPSLASS